VPYHPLRLELSRVQKKELLLLMKSTRDKEEYRRAYALKQKMEGGVPYRIIAKDMGVNYRTVYDWINNYRKDGLNGIKNKRKNGGRRPIISIPKNKAIIKDIVLNKSPRTFGYLKNTRSIRLLAIHLSSLLGINVSRSQMWRIIHDLGIVYKQPKLELEKEKEENYEEKKGRKR
jgi:transposase